MKGMLIIQGEGRGHISQAISYCENNPQIKICCVIISSNREIPDRFFDHFGEIQIVKLSSLNFEYKNGKIDFTKTLFNNIIKLPKFILNLFKVRNKIKYYDPDVVLNFYEALSFLSTLNLKTKKISIANQYLFYTNGLKIPSMNIKYYMIKFWNYITSVGSDEILAPSFIKFPNNKKVKTIDPLIRKDIKSIIPKSKDYILVYLINSYIVDKFLKNVESDKNYELFCDHKPKKLPSNVKYNKLDVDNFTNKLSNCRRVIATSGFQLICESLYLNKEIEVIPIHYEQEINGYNLEIHSLGKVSELFK